MSSKQLKNTFKIFIPFAISITLLCGVFYLALQQNYRLSANDRQIEISEGIANAINNGDNPARYESSGNLDLAQTLSIFVMMFDENGKLISSTVNLDGKPPVVPNGVFNLTRQKGETRFTWQPKTGVREAVVVNYFKGSKPGFVLVGRSLREVEARIDNLNIIMFLGWATTIVFAFFSVYILQKIK